MFFAVARPVGNSPGVGKEVVSRGGLLFAELSPRPSRLLEGRGGRSGLDILTIVLPCISDAICEASYISAGRQRAP